MSGDARGHIGEARDNLSQAAGLGENRARPGGAARGGQAAQIQARAGAELREGTEQHPVCPGGAARGLGGFGIGGGPGGIFHAQHGEAAVLPQPGGQHIAQAGAQIVLLLHGVDHHRQHGDFHLALPALRRRGRCQRGEKRESANGAPPGASFRAPDHAIISSSAPCSAGRPVSGASRAGCQPPRGETGGCSCFIADSARTVKDAPRRGQVP